MNEEEETLEIEADPKRTKRLAKYLEKIVLTFWQVTRSGPLNAEHQSYRVLLRDDP